MEIFYIIVFTVLTIVLILSLAVIGSFMTFSKEIYSNVRTKNCPDYWKSFRNNNIVYCQVDPSNKGKLVLENGYYKNIVGKDKNYILGSNTNNKNLINFNDSSWIKSAINNKNTLKQEWKDWANVNNIIWDTITNK